MTRVFAYTTYANDAIRIARKMKEPHSESMARQVGKAMAEWLIHATAFAPEHYDALIPIPQHWFRRLTLRYNQSEVLASSIASTVGSRVEDAWLQRDRWTQKQGMKTIAERVVNMKDAFRISEKHKGRIEGRRFLLVDDVMTSGATLDQAAAVLKRHGAVMVDAVVFARGLGGARPAPPKSATQTGQ
jgi:ComF family protein